MAVQTGNDINNSMRTKSSGAVVGSAVIHNARRNHQYAPLEKARLIETKYSYQSKRQGYNIRNAGEVRGKIMADRIDGYGRFRRNRVVGREQNIASMRSSVQTNALRKVERTRKVKVNGKYAWQLTKNTGIRTLRGTSGLLSAAELTTVSAAGATAQATGSPELSGLVTKGGTIVQRGVSSARRHTVSLITGDGKRRIRVERQQQLNKANKNLYKSDKKLERSVKKYDKTQTKLEKLKNNGRNSRSIRRTENKLLRQDRKVLTNAQIKQRAMGARAQALRKVKSPVRFKNVVKKALVNGIRHAMFSVAGLAIGLAAMTMIIFLFVMAGAGGGAAEQSNDQVANMSATEMQVYQFLIGKGLGTAQAAAIMGNLQQECGWNYAQDNGTAVGLCQWTDNSSCSNRTAFINWCNGKGYNYLELGPQLEYFWESYNTAASGYLYTEYTGNWGTRPRAAFERESDVVEATWIFYHCYEDPQEVYPTDEEVKRNPNPDTQASHSRRSSYNGVAAWKWRKEYAEKYFMATSALGASVGDIVNNCVYYNQGEYPNVLYDGGTVADSGCGVTAFAMIASQYTGAAYTPDVLGAWAYSNGVNTVATWSAFTRLANHCSIPAPEIHSRGSKSSDMQVVLAALQRGDLVIMNMKNYDGRHYWTGKGHYVTLVGTDSNGNFIVNDPGSRERTGRTHTPENTFGNYSGYLIFPRPQRMSGATQEVS